jgi:hypothetical protein
VLALVDVDSLTLAGAFVLGATLGSFAAIRTMRAVLREADPMRRRRDP